MSNSLKVASHWVRRRSRNLLRPRSIRAVGQHHVILSFLRSFRILLSLVEIRCSRVVISDNDAADGNLPISIAYCIQTLWSCDGNGQVMVMTLSDDEDYPIAHIITVSVTCIIHRTEVVTTTSIPHQPGTDIIYWVTRWPFESLPECLLEAHRLGGVSVSNGTMVNSGFHLDFHCPKSCYRNPLEYEDCTGPLHIW